MNEDLPSCPGPFSGIQIEFPVHFDLRIIYIVADAPNLSVDLEATLSRIGVPCSLIQGMAKPGSKYGRMGARVMVDSKQRMDKLYATVADIKGVKAII